MAYSNFAKAHALVQGGAFKPSIELCYGPWASVAAAFAGVKTELGIADDSGLSIIPIGLTVGVIENGKITEYWFKDGHALANLVKKSEVTNVVDSLTSTSTTDALSANQGKVLSDGIQAVDLREEQSWTDDEKKQARTNIGAVSEGDLGNLEEDVERANDTADEAKTLATTAAATAEKTYNQGRLFGTASAINIENPKDGDWVLVGTASPYEVYRYDGATSKWLDTLATYTAGSVTTADQITDTNLSKNQQAINSEVQTEVTALDASVDGIISPFDTSVKSDLDLYTDVLGGYLTKGTEGATTTFVTYDSYSTTKPIHLGAGDSISGQLIGSNIALIAETDETASYYKIIKSVDSTSDPNEISYTAATDMYIALSYYSKNQGSNNHIEKTAITKAQPSAIHTAVAANTESIKALDTRVTNAETHISNAENEFSGETETSFDFSSSDLIKGYLTRTTGTKVVDESSNYRISQPIHLSSGGKLTGLLYGNNVCMIAKTDATGSTYTQLVPSTTDTSENKTTVDYTATEEMYVAICFYSYTKNSLTINTYKDGTLQDIAKAVNQNTADIKALGGNGTSIKSYFETEMETTITTLNSKMSKPCLVLNIVTDTHTSADTETQRRTGETIANIKYLNTKIKADGVVHMGDIVSADMTSSTDDEIYKVISNYISSLYGTSDRVYSTIGNHDGEDALGYQPNRWFAAGGRLNREYVISSKAQTNDAGASYIPSYYYKDFASLGVRCVFLAVPENDENYSYAMCSAQLKWFAEEALNVANGTKVIIFAHIVPFDEDFGSTTSSGRLSQYNSFKGICDAFYNHTTYTETARSISADYTALTTAKIVAYFGGHQHFDNVANVGWTYNGVLPSTGASYTYKNEFQFPVINVGANLLTTPTWESFGGTAPERADKTVTQDLWDTMVYVPSDSKIYLVRFGAGSDREINV